MLNIHQAKTHFSKLIHQTLQGDDVIIAKSGMPIVRVIPYVDELPKRKGGQLKGILQMTEDFDQPLPEEYLERFYCKEL